jgi:hypothetical protein
MEELDSIDAATGATVSPGDLVLVSEFTNIDENTQIEPDPYEVKKLEFDADREPSGNVHVTLAYWNRDDTFRITGQRLSKWLRNGDAVVGRRD